MTLEHYFRTLKAQGETYFCRALWKARNVAGFPAPVSLATRDLWLSL